MSLEDFPRSRRQSGAPAWMVTYADTMGILLAFFIMLVTFSTVDSTKYRHIVDSMEKNFGPNAAEKLQEVLVQTEQEALTRQPTLTTNSLRQQLLSTLDQEIKQGMVDVSKNNERIVIRFPERFAFPTASETLTEQFSPVIAKIVVLLEKTRGSIIVAGHTDDVPINNERFRSNWELSSSRAVSVIHALLAQSNIPATRFVAEGHAETQPLAPNINAANRASNRRVEISIKDIDEPSFSTQVNAIRRDISEPLHPAAKE